MPGDQTKIIVGAASMAVDGSDIGFTQGGITLRKQNEFIDVDADQLAGVARKEITFQRMFLSTTLLEGTLANLRKAMAEPVSQEFDGSALSLGAANPAVVEHQIIVTGDKDGTGTGRREYTFFRCIAVEEVEFMMGAREQASVIPIVFEVLKDPLKDSTFCQIRNI